LLAFVFLPESLPPAERGRHLRPASAFSRARLRIITGSGPITLALLVQFVIVLSFTGLEQTFRLFTLDEFHMSMRGTGYVLGLSGVVMVLVQALIIRRLSRVLREETLVRLGTSIQVAGFLCVAVSPTHVSVALLCTGMATIALGSALTNPSMSAFVSRESLPERQGATLGVLQSAGALARVIGPAASGLLYQGLGHRAPYFAAAAGMALACAIALRMRPGEIPLERTAEPR